AGAGQDGGEDLRRARSEFLPHLSRRRGQRRPAQRAELHRPGQEGSAARDDSRPQEGVRRQRADRERDRNPVVCPRGRAAVSASPRSAPLPRRSNQWPAPLTAAPVIVARRAASGVLRLRATRTSPSMTTAEMPGMSPRAIALSASGASDAAGASQTTRSAGWPTASVAVVARRKARALLPVASASTVSGARSPSEASSQTLLSTP